MISFRNKQFLSLLLAIAFLHATSAAINLSIVVTDASRIYFAGTIGGNGSINVFASGGIAPYQFTLNNNLSNNNGYFSSLYPASYNVKVSDANGQYVDTNIIVSSIYPVPSVDTTNVIFPSSCNSSNGSFTLVGSGGTLPYLYSIDGGVTFSSNNVFTNLQQGWYEGILKDANGMEAVVTIHSSIYPEFKFEGFSCSCCPFPGHVISYGSACSPNNYGVIEASGNNQDTLAYQYSLDGITYFDPPARGLAHTFEFLPAGSYLIYIKDDTGALYITHRSILKYCGVQINYLTVDASCQQNDGSIIVTAINGVPPYTFTLDGINYQTSNNFSGLAPGIYNFSVKDVNGTVSSSTATIYNKCPVISVVKTDEVCASINGSITVSGLRGTRPYQYSLDGIHYQVDSFFSGLNAATYFVTLKDANGFVDTVSVIINNKCLMLSSVITNETCSKGNGAISVLVSGGTPPYLYSINGSNFQNDSNFIALSAGIYILRVKDANSVATIITDTITNIAGPGINVTIASASCNSTGGSITMNTTSGTPPFQYSIDGTHFQGSNLFAGINAGNYTVVLKDANGCVDSLHTNVSKYPTPTVFIGNDTSLCIGQSVLLKAPIGNQYLYKWQDSSTNSTLAARQSNLFWVEVTNDFGCVKRDSINIVFNQYPIFSFGNDTSLCENDSLELTPHFAGATSYSWSTGSISPAIRIFTADNYWCDVNKDGCVFRDSIKISLKPLPVINLGIDTTLCEGVTIRLNAFNQGSTYLWQDNSTNSSYTVSKKGEYTASVYKDGCEAADSIYINYLSKPQISLGVDQSICQGQSIILRPAVDAGWKLLWQDNSMQSFYNVTIPGNYYLDATNKCGTTRSEISFIQELCDLNVPNAFSPNGDTRNNLFKISGTSLIKEFHLKIFNRYGQMIFETSDKNNGWDGSYKGLPAEIGAYVYILQYKDNKSAQLRILKGSFLLIR